VKRDESNTARCDGDRIQRRTVLRGRSLQLACQASVSPAALKRAATGMRAWCPK
jgi:hypothetical protein